MSAEQGTTTGDLPPAGQPYVPPPPSGPPGRRAAAAAAQPIAASGRPAQAPTPRSRGAEPQATVPTKRGDRPAGYRFEATMDVSELDDRSRPGPVWSARALRLSRSNLVFMARRMCYVGSRLVLAVHLIDSSPVQLFGVVNHCDYEGDGLYRVDMDLVDGVSSPLIDDWSRAASAHAKRVKPA